MGKLLIIIGIIIVIGFVFFKFGLESSESEISNTKRPNNLSKPANKIKNDKIIVVINLKLEYLKQAIEQFCNMSNQDQLTFLPSLTKLDNKFVILFPYDIAFDQFCYFVNYIKYAHELSAKSDYKPEIKAWCTTNLGMQWITTELMNKEVMIYIPDWDSEYDNVYLTTQENVGFKMGFALGDEHTKLANPVISFQKRNVDLETINEKETIDFL